MGLYAKYVLPRVVDFTCGLKPTMRQRQKVVPLARGRVLEVGVGSGLNLPFYQSDQIEHIWGLDPSAEMLRLAERQALGLTCRVEFLEASADAIPLDEASADTIVVTYTMCTIPEVGPALADMRRVLKPDGELIFCEHGLAPDEGVRRWQNRMNPVWKRLGGGCHLNRDIPALLVDGGFRVRNLEAMYIPGWRPASFNYWGVAG